MAMDRRISDSVRETLSSFGRAEIEQELATAATTAAMHRRREAEERRAAEEVEAFIPVLQAELRAREERVPATGAGSGAALPLSNPDGAALARDGGEPQPDQPEEAPEARRIRKAILATPAGSIITPESLAATLENNGQQVRRSNVTLELGRQHGKLVDRIGRGVYRRSVGGGEAEERL
jgi:hypothetical protein